MVVVDPLAHMKKRLTTYQVSGSAGVTSETRVPGAEKALTAPQATLARFIQVDEESRIHVFLGERRNDI